MKDNARIDNLRLARNRVRLTENYDLTCKVLGSVVAHTQATW